VQLSVTFTVVKYFQARLEPTQVEPGMWLHSKDRLLALQENKVEATLMSNALAYYDRELIKAVKVFKF
jgi:hypothetical protein